MGSHCLMGTELLFGMNEVPEMDNANACTIL